MINFFLLIILHTSHLEKNYDIPSILNKWYDATEKNVILQISKKECMSDIDVSDHFESIINYFRTIDKNESDRILILDFLKRTKKLRENSFIVETIIGGEDVEHIFSIITPHPKGYFEFETYSFLRDDESSLMKKQIIEDIDLMGIVNDTNYCQRGKNVPEPITISYFANLKGNIQIYSRYYNPYHLNSDSPIYKLRQKLLKL